MVFPAFKPAFTIQAMLDPSLTIGQLSTGATQLYINIASCKIESEPSYEHKFSATTVSCSDVINADPTGTHMRLNLRGLLKTDDGALITLAYPGLIILNEKIKAILMSGALGPKSTGFGNILNLPKFETGSEKYKFLENNFWTGSGQFVMTENDGLMIEYHVSQIIAPSQ